jgi:hypothetical protein
MAGSERVAAGTAVPASLAAFAVPSAVARGLWCSIRAVLAGAGSRSADDGTRCRAEALSTAVIPKFGHAVGCEDAERAATVCERDQGSHVEREPDD